MLQRKFIFFYLIFNLIGYLSFLLDLHPKIEEDYNEKSFSTIYLITPENHRISNYGDFDDYFWPLPASTYQAGRVRHAAGAPVQFYVLNLFGRCLRQAGRVWAAAGAPGPAPGHRRGAGRALAALPPRGGHTADAHAALPQPARS